MTGNAANAQILSASVSFWWFRTTQGWALVSTKSGGVGSGGGDARSALDMHSRVSEIRHQSIIELRFRVLSSDTYIHLLIKHFGKTCLSFLSMLWCIKYKSKLRLHFWHQKILITSLLLIKEDSCVLALVLSTPICCCPTRYAAYRENDLTLCAHCCQSTVR